MVFVTRHFTFRHRVRISECARCANCVSSASHVLVFWSWFCPSPCLVARAASLPLPRMFSLYLCTPLSTPAQLEITNKHICTTQMNAHRHNVHGVHDVTTSKTVIVTYVDVVSSTHPVPNIELASEVVQLATQVSN